MSGISHRQGMKLIDRRLDGLLGEKQTLLLEEHLRSCDSCRAYSTEMKLISAHLQNEFHLRWDKDLGPSQKVLEQVPRKARSIPLTNSISSGVKLLAGIAVFALLVIALNYIFPNTQNDTASPVIETPAVTSNSETLTIDSYSCKSYSDVYDKDSTFRPPGQLYNYKLIQGIWLSDGDFLFDFWLYCDPSLKPDDPTHWSTIAGLGVYASWSYNGPKVEGTNQDYYGFEPDIRMSTGWIGPLYKAHAAGRFGIEPSEQAIQQHIQQGTPIQFRVMVDSSVGRNGAIFSFNLEPTERGLKVVDLRAGKLDHLGEGLIAFTSEQSGNFDIYTMHADGSELTNLTNDPADDYNPIWSPDGKRIAFISNRENGIEDIYVMNSDGSNVVRSTYNPFDIKLMNDRGKKKIFPQYSWLGWSPDSQFILAQLWEGRGPGLRLVVARADGGGANYVEDFFEGPQWSPDGTKISFIKGVSETNIVVLDANSLIKDGRQKHVEIMGSPGWREWQTAVWSPDGTRLAGFVMNEATKIFELWVINASSNEHKTISELGSNKQNTGPLIPPAWSPDGEQLVFVQNGKIMLANSESGELATLSTIEPFDSLKWSPDGYSLLFTAGNPRQIYLLDVNDSLKNPGKIQAIQITNNPDHNSDQPDWQP